jgi:hypothetical protein
MIENFITNINNFNPNQLDYENLNGTKTFYSIYNNKISTPFHNFWFLLSNCKFKFEYSNFKTLKFGLNNKSNEIQKFLNFFKDLSKHLEQIFSKVYTNLTVELPWKEYDNYPNMINIFTSDTTLLVDDKKESIGLDNLTNTKSYTILFEIKNIRIVKISLDDNQTHTLKFNLNMIMIQQEQELDLKSCLLGFVNQNNNQNKNQNQNNYTYNNFLSNSTSTLTSNSNLDILNNQTNQINQTNLPNHINMTRPKLPFLTQLSSINTNEDKPFLNSISAIKHIVAEKKTINLQEILAKKSNLRKVSQENTNNQDTNDNQTVESTYINQKNQLKKTITEEKSLLKRLKKSKKKKDKDKKNKEISIDTDNINNIEQLEEDLEKDLESILSIEKKSKIKIEDSNDLEKELELLMSI